MHPTRSPSKSVTLTTRALDAVDRAHARVASSLHGIRNKLLSRLEHSLDRAEQITSTALERARHGVQRADVVSADVVNRAQGVVGQAIEKVRVNRLHNQHVVS